MLDVNRVIVLAPHTDDGEFGCGGTLARFIEQGVAIYYVALSICEASVPEGFPRDILASEVKEATQVLGIDADHLTVHRYPVRRFPQYRQDILEELVRLRREIEPDLVLVPSYDDIHQDHQVVFQEGLRAFKHNSILGYEMPWNNLALTASAFVHLQPRHVDRKIAALDKYRSQQHRNYAAEDFIRSLSRVRGAQAGVVFAEAFQVIRWVIA
jgi:LmbE family N-acetylglucosaminyl deacetylase